MKPRTLPMSDNTPISLGALSSLAQRETLPPDPVRFTDHYARLIEEHGEVVFRVRCYEDGRTEASRAPKDNWDRTTAVDVSKYPEKVWVRLGYCP